MATAKKENSEMSLAEMQAQMAKMMQEMEAAKAEYERMIADAKTVTGNTMTPEERAAYEAKMNEEVEIKLFKDTGKYKDDVLVGCNGEFIAIKRGERVKIKRKYAEILDNSEHQDYETAQLIEQKSREFEAATKAYIG